MAGSEQAQGSGVHKAPQRSGALEERQVLGTHHIAYPTGHGSSCWPGLGCAAWERCSMLGVMSKLTRHYITPKMVPPTDFGQGLAGYTEFLDLTKKLCSKVSGQTLDSLQTEHSAFKQQRFLDR